MTEEDIKFKILTEPDFVNLKRFNYSIDTALEKHPDGLPDKMIAQALMISEEEVQECYASVIEKLRSLMGVDLAN